MQLVQETEHVFHSKEVDPLIFYNGDYKRYVEDILKFIANQGYEVEHFRVVNWESKHPMRNSLEMVLHILHERKNATLEASCYHIICHTLCDTSIMSHIICFCL